MVGTDGSETAALAVDRAVELAQALVPIRVNHYAAVSFVVRAV